MLYCIKFIKKLKRGVLLEIKNLTENDLDNLMELQALVYENLEDKMILETIDRREFAVMIEQGFIIGGYDENELVAVRAMYIPPLDDPEHLAEDGGVTDRSQVIYSEISFIHPDYRGLGMQTELGGQLIEKVRADGRFKYIFTTVLPTNVPSLKDKFRLGFKIVNTRVMYGGKNRHVLQLNINDPIEVSGEKMTVDYQSIDWMLDNGEIYIGFDFDGIYIDYYLK